MRQGSACVTFNFIWDLTHFCFGDRVVFATSGSVSDCPSGQRCYSFTKSDTAGEFGIGFDDL
jgi:hypothetical protein